MVLAAGVGAVQLGALSLIVGYMNRASGAQQARLQALFLYIGGMFLVCLTVLELEITSRLVMHRAGFYRVVATVAPLVLAAIARGARHKWAATIVASVYMAFVLLMSWILPLFPAEPKLGPVLYPVTQFTPPEFPMLLIVPAFALDLLWQRTARWGAWKQSLVSAVVFLAVFAAVQWPFADFLMSPAARNWVFGAKYFGYYTNPLGLYAQFKFAPPEPAADFWRETALAFAIGVLGTRIGLLYGDRLRGTQR
jgi:hypothetical protein